MPEDMATTDKLLRCVNDFASLMISEGQKSRPSFVLGQGQSPDHHQLNEIRRQQIRGCINATTESYEGAHYYLKLGEPSKAIRKFQDAVTTVLPMFGEVNLFLLTRLIEIATWSSWKKFPGYEPVVFRFLTASAAQKLGPQHPLVLLLSCFAQAAAISPSYPTIWSCVIDHIDHMADDKVPRAEAQSIRIKAYFYLIRVLRNNGNHCAAIQRCHELIQLCIAIDGTRAFSTNRARYNLGVNYCEAGNQDAAITAYEEARKYRGTADAPHDGWVFAVFASSEIAQLCEQKGDIAKASEYYEEALLGFTQCGGDSSSGALLMLKDLLEFHERHNHVDTLTQIAENYPACYSLLKGGRLDDDQRWVGCRVTTQASRGKVARAWTWTSPMT
jgi:tetratricopeptide (TPR) repeat protein